MVKKKLLIIITSTRPNCTGLSIGKWVLNKAESLGEVELEMVELTKLNLPMMDEPNHPKLGKYEHDHTKSWSEKVSSSDAILFLMPEYNHSFNAPLKNAIDYLFHEWNKMPVGLLSYGGGMSGGIRAVESLLPVLVALQMSISPANLAIPFVQNCVDENQNFNATEQMENDLLKLLSHLKKTIT